MWGYGLPKVWLDICVKVALQITLQEEHGKPVSTLFKSEREHLWHIYCSTGRQFSGQESLLVIWKSLRLFVNTTSAIDKCSLPNRYNSMQPIHMQLSQKLKDFHNFLLHFQNLLEILNIFKKKMTLKAHLFLRLLPAKNVVRYMCKSPTSDYPSKSNMVNGSQLCLNLSESTCSIFVAQREGNLVAKSLFEWYEKA